MNMTALTLRAISALPAPLAELIRTHRYTDDIGDLVGEAWICLAEARGDTTLEQIFSQARSRVRRQTQDPAHYAVGIDDLAGTDAEPRVDGVGENQEQEPMRRRNYVVDIMKSRGVGRRRAQQIVAQQIERVRCGDLFSGVTV